MFYFLSLSLHTSKKKKKKNATREERIHISKSKPARHNTASFLSLSLWRFGASFLPRRRLRRRRRVLLCGEKLGKNEYVYMTAPENNESRCSSVVLMDILKRAHAHVVDAVRADENEYLESAVRSYALAMDYFKTYLKMSEIEKKKYGE